MKTPGTWAIATCVAGCLLLSAAAGAEETAKSVAPAKGEAPDCGKARERSAFAGRQMFPQAA